MQYATEKHGIEATYAAIPADTNAATLYSVPTGIDHAHVDSINIAVNGASNVTVQVNNGTTDYPLLWTFAMGANTQRRDEFGVVLQPGWSIKVTTSNADDACFVANIREFIR